MQTRLRRSGSVGATARGQMQREANASIFASAASLWLSVGGLFCALLPALLVSHAASSVIRLRSTVTSPARTRRQRALARHPWERHPSAKFAAAWANSQRCAR